MLVASHFVLLPALYVASRSISCIVKNRQNFVFWVSFFGLEDRNSPFASYNATILKLSLLWTRSTPLTLHLLSWYVITFRVFVRSRTCWLCFVAPIPGGRHYIALLAPIVVNCGEYANATFRVNLRFAS